MNIKWIPTTLQYQYEQFTEQLKLQQLSHFTINDIKKAWSKKRIIQFNQTISNNTNNTDYNDIKTLDDVKQMSQLYQRDVDQIIKQYQNGKQYTPIIGKLDDNQYWCFAGNTRLMVAKVLGITPKVTYIDLSMIINQIRHIIRQELSNDVQLLNWQQWQDDDKIFKITRFYNGIFTNSQHRYWYKLKQYYNYSRQPIIIVAIKDDNVIGLLQSWKPKLNTGIKDTRLLVTVAVDQQYRSKGYFKQMFNMMLQRAKQSNIILHFRQSNKNKLQPKYTKMGFKDIEIVGQYKNGQNKYQMVYSR